MSLIQALSVHPQNKKTTCPGPLHMSKVSKRVTVIAVIYHHHRINVVFPQINLLPRWKFGIFRHLENAAMQPGYCVTQDPSLSIALTQKIQEIATHLIKLLRNWNEMKPREAPKHGCLPHNRFSINVKCIKNKTKQKNCSPLLVQCTLCTAGLPPGSMSVTQMCIDSWWPQGDHKMHLAIYQMTLQWGELMHLQKCLTSPRDNSLSRRIWLIQLAICRQFKNYHLSYFAKLNVTRNLY